MRVVVWHMHREYDVQTSFETGREEVNAATNIQTNMDNETLRFQCYYKDVVFQVPTNHEHQVYLNWMDCTSEK